MEQNKKVKNTEMEKTKIYKIGLWIVKFVATGIAFNIVCFILSFVLFFVPQYIMYAFLGAHD